MGGSVSVLPARINLVPGGVSPRTMRAKAGRYSLLLLGTARYRYGLPAMTGEPIIGMADKRSERPMPSPGEKVDFLFATAKRKDG